MIKTTLKIDGMACSMCEAHMNDLIRKVAKVKKVTSSAKAGETVVISEEELDIPLLGKEIEGSDDYACAASARYLAGTAIFLPLSGKCGKI